MQQTFGQGLLAQTIKALMVKAVMIKALMTKLGIGINNKKE